MSWGETIFLKKAIDGKKTFRASDNVLVNINNGGTYNTDSIIATFKPNTNGQIKLKAEIKGGGVGYTGGIIIEENGVVIGRLYASQETTLYTEESFVFDSKKKSIYNFIILGSPVISLKKVELCADIVDGSLFDYTIGGNE